MAIWGNVSSLSTFAPLSNRHPGSDHSLLPPSLAPESQKSGSPTTGFREGERSFRHGTNRWPVRPRRRLLQDPEPRQPWPASLHVTTRGLTVRVSFQGSFFLTSHPATSRVPCRMPGHQRLTRGSWETSRAGPLHSPDISPSLVPPCPVFALLAQTFASTRNHHASSVDPAEWPTASQLATVPLACLQFLTRANSHDGTRLTISLQWWLQ